MRSHSLRRATIMGAAIVAIAPALAASGATRVLPHGKPAATERALLDLLAGSPGYLVYAEGDQLAGGSHLGDAPPINAPSEHLFARTKAGKTVDLGHAPANLNPAMSMVGSMLTGFTEAPDFGDLVSVRWWNVASHRSGSISLPKGYRYQSAAPNGIVMSKGGKLVQKSTSGKLTSLGTPVAAATSLAVTAATNGVIVDANMPAAPPHNTRLYYLRFGHPGHFTTLNTGTTKDVVCHTLDAVAAGCVDEGRDSDGDPTFDSLSLIPLDGSAPTVTTSGPTDEDPALVGDTLIWDSPDGLRSVTLGHSAVSTGPQGLEASRRYLTINGDDPYQDLHGFSRPMLSALGQAAVVHASGNDIALAASVHATKTVVRARPSRASVSDFDLTGGRVVYATDRRLRHHPGAQFSTYAAKLTTRSGRGLEVAKPHRVHADTDYLHVAASKAVTVYASSSDREFTRLRVLYHHRLHTIVHVPYNAYLQVSGTRVMYAQNYNDGIASVYDAATGKTTTIQTESSCCTTDQGANFGTVPALSGDAVSFIKTNGSVWRQRIGARAPTRIAGPVAHSHGGVVFAAGNYVAWSITRGHNYPYARVNGFRNVKTMSQPVSVTAEITGMSSDGVITATPNLVFTQSVTAAFSLRMFAGKTMRLLSKRTIVGLPQVVGSTLAWVDSRGLLRLRQIHLG